MTARTAPEKDLHPLAPIAILVVGVFMLIGLISGSIEGDTTAVDPDVRRYPLPRRVAEFEREFQPGFWSAGPHKYTLAVDCPGYSNDLKATHSFQASATSTSIPGQVYLRLKGLLVRRNGPDTFVTELNPAESSSALVILELKPDEGAEHCVVSMVVDGRLEFLPRTDLYTVDVDDDW